MSEPLAAKVLVEFTIKNAVNQEDLDDMEWELDQMVRWLIQEEGLFGICEDDFRIVSVSKATDDA